METRVDNLELRLTVQESTRYDGILIWKITEYTQRKNEAKMGKTVSLYSQPFYTSHSGYKICGRAYLNGDGSGKGSHLSFFFVLMKGEHDALQKWPYHRKTSLTLMDQNGGNSNITRTFEPEKTNKSFQRPETNMNIASGIPSFVKHVDLETPMYLKDDTIFLQIKIH